jgi:hypothetical protein
MFSLAVGCAGTCITYLKYIRTVQVRTFHNYKNNTDIAPQFVSFVV